MINIISRILFFILNLISKILFFMINIISRIGPFLLNIICRILFSITNTIQTSQFSLLKSIILVLLLAIIHFSFETSSQAVMSDNQSTSPNIFTSIPASSLFQSRETASSLFPSRHQNLGQSLQVKIFFKIIR